MDIVSHWQSFNFKIAAVVFFVYLLVDAMFAHYTLAVTKNKPIAAANVGSMMYFFIAIGVLNYVQNYLYVIPLVLGSWIGTYVVVKRGIK